MDYIHQGRRHCFKSTGSYQQNLLSQPTFDQIIKKSTASKVPFLKNLGPCPLSSAKKNDREIQNLKNEKLWQLYLQPMDIIKK